MKLATLALVACALAIGASAGELPCQPPPSCRRPSLPRASPCTCRACNWAHRSTIGAALAPPGRRLQRQRPAASAAAPLRSALPGLRAAPHVPNTPAGTLPLKPDYDCDPSSCKPENNCRCASYEAPLPKDQMPQFVLYTVSGGEHSGPALCLFFPCSAAHWLDDPEGMR